MGLGLLLLRAAVGVAAIIHGVVYLSDSGAPALGVSLVGGMEVVSGASLLAGFLTPIAGGILALGAIATALSSVPLHAGNPFETKLMAVLAVVVAAAVILLGPGALSLDARLFGRREIIIPRSPRSSNS